MARGEGAAARPIEKEDLTLWGVEYSPPICYTDFRLLSYFDRLQPKCPIEFRMLGCLKSAHISGYIENVNRVHSLGLFSLNAA
jgi:hypothetical protein